MVGMVDLTKGFRGGWKGVGPATRRTACRRTWSISAVERPETMLKYQIPCFDAKIPCSAERIPCSCAQEFPVLRAEIRGKTIEIAA